MSKKDKSVELVIDYKSLGTISLDELQQAFWDDIQALKDIYNVQYVTAPTLRIPVTNEYGDPLIVRGPTGKIITRLDTHHYHPACLDYKL